MGEPAPRRSWCFGEYFHTTDPVECSCAEDLEPGSEHDVTVTPRVSSAEELVDAIGDVELGIEFSVRRVKAYANTVLEAAAQDVQERGMREAATVIRRRKGTV